jgi:hypothetical protein
MKKVTFEEAFVAIIALAVAIFGIYFVSEVAYQNLYIY